MDALHSLSERLETERVAASFTGTRMNLAAVLSSNRFSFDLVHTDALVPEKVARDIYDDLVLYLSLVEHFNLNTRIWSKA